MSVSSPSFVDDVFGRRPAPIPSQVRQRARDVASIVSRILDVLVWVLGIAALLLLGFYLKGRLGP